MAEDGRVKETGTVTHARRAVIELRERILSGAIPGGTRIYEVILAEELNISRTPMREAMSRLVEEGLLQRLPNGGFSVRSFGIAEVVDAIELRGVLEGTAARFAAERGVPDEQLEEIEAVVEKIDGCFGTAIDDVDFECYADLNDKFHHLLWDLAQSELLSREMRRVASLPFASPSSFLPNRTELARFNRSLRTAQEQHKSIIDAIRRREGARAEAIAREHARSTRHNLEHILYKAPELIGVIPELHLLRQ